MPSPYELHLARVQKAILAQNRGPISFGPPALSPLEVVGIGRATEELANLAVPPGTSFGKADLAKVDLRATERNLAAGQPVAPPALVAYESIILGKRFPVLRVRADQLVPDGSVSAALPSPILDFLGDAARVAGLRPVFSAVARIDVAGMSVPYVGTAFIVGPDLLLTNRHVAKLFAWGDRKTISIGSTFQPHGAFGHELASGEEGAPPDLAGLTAAVVEVAWIHPYWDAALLRLEAGALAGRDALVLEAEELADTAGQPLAVVGFPAFQPTSDPSYDDLQRVVFQGVFGVKRFAPGLGDGVADTDFGVAGESVVRRVLRHNSSTLGGNSGSAVVDLRSGRVIGLHFWGDPNQDNLAVPTWELAKDPVVRASGLAFSAGSSASGAEPSWAALWGDAEAPTPPEAPIQAPPTQALAAAARVPDRPLRQALGPLWFQTASDEAVVAILSDPQLGPAALREAVAVLGPTETRLRLELVRGGKGSPEATGLHRPIIFLNGLPGANLMNMDTGERLWLDPLRIVFGDVAHDLILAPDGHHNLSGARVSSAGLLEIAYGLATRWWAVAGHPVVPFAFDWRLPIADSADALDAVVRATAKAHGPVVLAAHSMGGLVAMVWAARNAVGPNDWEHLVAGAVLVGSAVGGLYESMEAMVGSSSDLKVVAAASIRDTTQDLCTMAASFPGIVGMFPDPKLFPTRPGDRPAAELYDRGSWPAPAIPTEEALAAAVAVRAAINQSPLFSRATAVIADEWPTTAGWKVGPTGAPMASTHEAGDDTATVRAAALPAYGERIFHASGFHHALMLLHPGIISAISQVAQDQPITSLPRWKRPADFGAPESLAVGPLPEATVDPATAAGLALRAGAMAGTLTPDDLRRVLSPAYTPVDPMLYDALDNLTNPAPAAEDTGGGELSGVEWVGRYLGDKTTATLIPPFRVAVQRFLAALEAAGALVVIQATFRPPQRAWLMRYAWDIAAGTVKPADVPVMPGLDICWVHSTDVEAISAAREMVQAYGLAYRPALTSRHCEGRAIDMSVLWTGACAMVDATGAKVNLDAAQGTDNNPALHAVGRSYGVIKLVADRPHWSDDGR